MIVFDLHCGESGERFEAWFGSNAEFEQQLEQGLVPRPHCQSSRVPKAPTAPLVSRGRGGEPETLMARLSALQAELLRDSRWVGDRFADTARAMHVGEIDSSRVH